MRTPGDPILRRTFLLRLAQPVVFLFGATTLLVAGIATPADAEHQSPAKHFDEQLAPLFARHCLGCHNPSDKKGGLDLTQAEGLSAGGDSGPVVVPGDAEASLLWERVINDEMPPPRKPPTTGPKLTAVEKELLKTWIAGGAAWGSGPIDWLKLTTDSRAGIDWWSLRPIVAPPLPDVAQRGWVIQPIDAYILARLEAAGLQPSPLADRRTLIRRLSFDLIGLPPTFAEVEAFVADPSPRAYEDLVDRLLASPHYGERWARHWLDVVRYAESQGFERDRLRPNSWQYRDWVVNAFNDDLPYDEFVRLQLAGDVLRGDDPRAVIATGFLVAGPWDEVGQTQQSEAMKAVVRQDELEELVAATCQTYLGLTVNCARCHDHKFDPVSQADYYRIAAALSGVRHGERATLSPGDHPAVDEQLASLEAEEAGLRARLEAIDAPLRERWLRERPPTAATVPAPLARWEFDTHANDELGTMHAQLYGGARIEGGRLVLPGGGAFAATAPLSRPLAAKTLEAWVQLANLDQRGGGVIGVQSLDGTEFDSIVYGEREARRWLAGSDHFIRTQDVGGGAETEAFERPIHVAVVYATDNTITVYRNGRAYGRSYQATGLEKFESGEAQIVFGLRHGPPGGNKVLIGAIERAALYDRALTPEEVAVSAGVPPAIDDGDEIWTALKPHERSERIRLLFEVSLVEVRRRLLAGGPAYAVVPSEPEVTHVLGRGDPRQPADVVAAGGVASVSGGQANFGLPPDAPEAQRRARLAEWITAPENPLTARVLANRLWHYHFGVGLVETPNDFGFNGGRPSHGDLLDWLAAELIRNGWSMKQLHRVIVLSAAYRQSATYQAEAARVDAGNRLLWRKSPLRQDAEILRDAMLSVAGQLNPVMGGPGYRDFRTFTNNSQFYEVYDAEGFAFQRRSLYRSVIRSGTSPLLDVFDCPDPSTIAPSRAVTTTPLQALALLNDSFVLRMADRFAERLRDECAMDSALQVERAFGLALARVPRPEEQAAAQAFVVEHGLAAFCRVLFNSNEFLYVD
ncbi:MAG TPA: DUF1553 domain-containing protein [Pirellulales bacterium]|nr:DUF1553 domain-containing protein [Pirellulales bacterium]